MMGEIGATVVRQETVRVTVHVTGEDIAHGARRSSQTCPVARALQRLVESDRVSAGYGAIWFPSGRSAPTPFAAYQRMLTFDMGGAMRPFTFEVELPVAGETPAETAGGWTGAASAGTLGEAAPRGAAP